MKRGENYENGFDIELGKREPNLIDLLSYSRISEIILETLIDDNLSIETYIKNKC